MVIMTKNRIENHGSDNCDKKMVMMKTGIKFTIVIIMVIWVIAMLTRSIKDIIMIVKMREIMRATVLENEDSDSVEDDENCDHDSEGDKHNRR